MASEMDDSPDPAAKAVPRRRPRPAPTIDLQATEVARGPEESVAPSAEDAIPSPAAAAADPPTKRAAPDATKTAVDEPVREPSAAPSARKRSAWSIVKAGAVGGGVVLLVFAVLWLAGVFSPRDEGSSALDVRLARVETRLREIANTPAPANIDRKTVDDLSSRIGKLEAAVAAPPPASDPALASRLAAVEEAVKSFQRNVADLNRRAEPTVERSDIEALTNRVAALEWTTKTLADDLSKRAANAGDRSARLAVSAQALRAAVERGDPFATELAAVKPLALDPQALAPLEPFATSGVPTQATLSRQLSELVPILSRLAAAPQPEGGFLDRLQASAERLVRIRPIDEAPGDDPTTIIARVEAKAARSDITGALAELAKLPAPLRAPAEEWIKKAQARTGVVDLSRRFASDALAALGKPSP